MMNDNKRDFALLEAPNRSCIDDLARDTHVDGPTADDINHNRRNSALTR